MNASGPTLVERIFWKYHYRNYLQYSGLKDRMMSWAPQLITDFESQGPSKYPHPRDAAFQAMVAYADSKQKDPYLEEEEEDKIARWLTLFHPDCEVPCRWKERYERALRNSDEKQRQKRTAEAALARAVRERDWSADYQALIDNQPPVDARRVWKALHLKSEPAAIVAERGSIEIGLVLYWAKQLHDLKVTVVYADMFVSRRYGRGHENPALVAALEELV